MAQEAGLTDYERWIEGAAQQQQRLINRVVCPQHGIRIRRR
jgi:hypothetical protein